MVMLIALSQPYVGASRICVGLTRNHQIMRERAYRCYCCLELFPHSQLGGNRIWAGYRGRLRNANVLMCRPCSANVNQHWEHIAYMEKVWTIFGIVIVAALGLLLFDIRGR